MSSFLRYVSHGFLGEDAEHRTYQKFYFQFISGFFEMNKEKGPWTSLRLRKYPEREELH